MRRALTIIFLASLLAAPGAMAQETGLPPFGSFSKGQFDIINNGNLNVYFAVPIMSSPGRGLNMNLSLAYNSWFWTVSYAGGGGAWTVSPTSNWGWLLNGPAGQTTYQTTITTGSCGSRTNPGYTDIYTFASYVYTDAAGTPHPLPLSVKETYSSCTGNTTYSGTYTGYATDASGYYGSINLSQSIYPTITDKFGTVINNTGTQITDRNGNYLTLASTAWTDSVGRTALKIVTGSSSTQYQYLDPTGNYQTTTVNFTSLKIQTAFGCSQISEYTNSSGVNLPTSVVLPNGQTYTISYEPTPGSSGYYTGRVAKVVLPTGGYYQYQYGSTNDGINCADGSTLNMSETVNDNAGNSATCDLPPSSAHLIIRRLALPVSLSQRPDSGRQQT